MDKTRETKISLYVTLVLFAIVVIFMVCRLVHHVGRLQQLSNRADLQHRRSV